MKQLLDAITEQADRLRQSRPGISSFAMRQHVHLEQRLGAAQAHADGARRDLAVRALEAQCVALVNELSRLSAQTPHSLEYANG
jgi:hypothetical protein